MKMRRLSHHIKLIELKLHWFKIRLRKPWKIILDIDHWLRIRKGRILRFSLLNQDLVNIRNQSRKVLERSASTQNPIQSSNKWTFTAKILLTSLSWANEKSQHQIQRRHYQSIHVPTLKLLTTKETKVPCITPPVVCRTSRRLQVRTKRVIAR